MVDSFRIKEYIFPATLTNTGNDIVTLTSHSLNGEILKIAVTSNFTGSAIIKDVNNQTFANITNASGTNTIALAPLTNTTGSFVVNGPLTCDFVSGTSGTGNLMGPVSIYYR
jgi:hypothetical protein